MGLMIVAAFIYIKIAKSPIHFLLGYKRINNYPKLLQYNFKAEWRYSETWVVLYFMEKT